MRAGSDEDRERQRRKREHLIAMGGSSTVDALKYPEAQWQGASRAGQSMKAKGPPKRAHRSPQF